MIQRPDYINAIMPFVDKPVIKILNGVRRCGKSTVLEMIRNEIIRRGVPQDSIVVRNYASAEFDDNFDSKRMYQDIKTSVSGKDRC